MEPIRCPRCNQLISAAGLDREQKSSSLITASFQTSLNCSRCGEISFAELPILKRKLERQQLRLMLTLAVLVVVAIVLMLLTQQGITLHGRG